MREEDEDEEHNWFARWKERLPRPEELMPLSQTLISPDLALAFDIPPPINHRRHHFPPSAQSQQPQQHSELDLSGDGGGDDMARTLKRPRLVWTPQLHKRFLDAVAHLGIKKAVPKTIIQLMSVDGLTRENVASHLQKYRLYLKRIGGGAAVAGASSAEDQLFASAPVPHHFLSVSRPGAAAVPFLPFHHHQIAAAAAQPPPPSPSQQFYYQHLRHIGHFGSSHQSHGNGGGAAFNHGVVARPTPAIHRILGAPPPHLASTASSRAGELESGTGREGERRILTLFPTGDDD